jgi:hypothetical protein
MLINIERLSTLKIMNMIGITNQETYKALFITGTRRNPCVMS